jgi:hypothetical protein
MDYSSLITMAIVVILALTAGNYLIQFFGKKDWSKAFLKQWQSAHM